jgi:hypothetical protein
MSVVNRAREHYDCGWRGTEIVKLLAAEGVTVTLDTVKRWTEPGYDERRRRAVRENNRRRWAKKWVFTLQGGRPITKAYQKAFILRLVDEGCGVSEIVRLCNVVLPDGGWTRHKVDYLLKSQGRAPQTRWNHRRTDAA